MKKKLVNMYLDWVNNFITTSAFADYYGITEEKAKRVINLGRKIHAMVHVDQHIIDFAKTHSRKETLLYNNRIYASYIKPSQQRKDEYSVNREWILKYFSKKSC